MTAPSGEAGQGPTTSGADGTTVQPGQVPAGTGTSAADSSTTGSSTAGKTFDETYVQSLRQESAGHRTKANTLQTELDAVQAKLKAYEDAQLTEAQKLQQQVEALTTVSTKAAQDAKDASLKYEVAVAAQQVGIVDSEAAVKLMDHGSLTWENGRPSNVVALLTSLVENKPYLKGQPTAAPQAPNPGPTNPGGIRPQGALTLDDVKKMSTNEINARWDEVSAVLAGKK